MEPFYVGIGDEVRFTKTLGESDVYLFAGITGDLARIHIDSVYARETPLGRRVVHGALLVGLMSTTGTLLIERFERRREGVQSYSVGYDRVRFIRPVFIGDTVTVTDTVTEIILDRERCRSKVEIHNQDGVIVCAAEHLIQWVRRAPAV
jgi:acyl dehydratase